MNLEDLRASVRNKIGDYESTNDSWSDARINDYLHEASIHVQSIIEQFDEHFFEEEFDQAMGISDTEITLPAGFKSLTDLKRIDGTNYIKFQIVQKSYDQRVAYQAYLTKDKIRYTVALNEAHTTRVTYIKELQPIIDGQSWGLPRVAENLLILQAVLLILSSEGVQSPLFQKEYDKAREALFTLENRQRNTPRHVHYINT